MGAKPSKKAKNQKKPVVLYIIVAAVVIVAVIAGVVIGLVTQGTGGDTGNNNQQIKLPNFVYGPSAPRGSVQAYQFALDHADILAQIPCYCGCGSEANHKSNLDCYIKSRDGNKVDFDDHASY